MKPRFRFVGVEFRHGRKRYVWQRKLPGDSRVEQFSCDAEWFWAGGLPTDSRIAGLIGR